MAALPYMQFYVADYLADTMHLTTEEHGAYLLLIFNYWQTGKPLPKARLARIARMTNERWTPVEQALSEFFADDGETWIHERIEQDLSIVKRMQNQRSKAGKASAKSRGKSTPKNTCSTPVATVEQQASNGKSTKSLTDTDTEVGSSSASTEISQGALASKLMRQSGCTSANPTHPDLLAALAEGVTPEVLAATAAEGIADGKTNPFRWAIQTARGRHADGAQPTPTGGTHGNHGTRSRNTGDPDDPNEPGISLAERSRRASLKRRQSEA